MNTLTTNISELIKKINGSTKVAFLSCLICGIVAHLYAFTNNLFYHDAMNFGGFGGTFTSGRWALGFIDIIASKLTLWYHSPMLDGVISIFFIAIAVSMIVDTFNIRSKLLAAILACTVVVFPSVTSNFAFYFTAPAYFLAFLLSIFAIWIVSKDHKVWKCIVGIASLIIAIGIYQAYFCVAIAFGFLIILHKTYASEENALEIIKDGFYILGNLIAGIVGYVFVNKLVVNIMAIELNPYQGMNEIGTFSLFALPKLVMKSYATFINVKWTGINTSNVCAILIALLLVIAAVIAMIDIIKSKKNRIISLLYMVLIAIMPIAFNNIYLMSSNDTYIVHLLMRYSLVFTFVFMVTVFDKSDFLERLASRNKGMAASAVLIALLIFIPLNYIYANNQAYVKMVLLQEEATNYFNVLVAQIKSCDGYTDDTPVAYIGYDDIQDKTLNVLDLEAVTFTGYNYTLGDLLNDYDNVKYIRIHTGFNPVAADNIETLKANEEVKAMPCYPDNGSIKMIDGIVVVKFSE